MAVTVYGLNCTLKAGPEESSTQKLLDQLMESLKAHGATGSTDRVVDFDIKPGVRMTKATATSGPRCERKSWTPIFWSWRLPSGWASRAA